MVYFPQDPFKVIKPPNQKSAWWLAVGILGHLSAQVCPPQEEGYSEGARGCCPRATGILQPCCLGASANPVVLKAGPQTKSISTI